MAKLYKAFPPDRFLDRIELILKDDYKAFDQTQVSEINTDDDGNSFTMIRTFKGIDRFRYLLYRFDIKPGDRLFPYPYFKLEDENKVRLGLAKVCDYVMFIEKGNESYIILIELKKGKEDPKPQLEQMKFFVKFLQQRAEYVGISIDAHIRMVGISDAVVKEYTKMKPKINYEDGFAQLYDGQFLLLSELAK